MVFNEPFTKKELNIKDDLHLYKSNIRSLPKGLKVGGDLQLQDCDNLKSLPKDLKVRKGLWLSGSPLGRLPNEKILNMVKPDGYIGKIY